MDEQIQELVKTIEQYQDELAMPFGMSDEDINHTKQMLLAAQKELEELTKKKLEPPKKGGRGARKSQNSDAGKSTAVAVTPREGVVAKPLTYEHICGLGAFLGFDSTKIFSHYGPIKDKAATEQEGLEQLLARLFEMAAGAEKLNFFAKVIQYGVCDVTDANYLVEHIKLGRAQLKIWEEGYKQKIDGIKGWLRFLNEQLEPALQEWGAENKEPGTQHCDLLTGTLNFRKTGGDFRLKDNAAFDTYLRSLKDDALPPGVIVSREPVYKVDAVVFKKWIKERKADEDGQKFVPPGWELEEERESMTIA